MIPTNFMPAFHPDMVSTHVNPLVDGVAEFPFEEVFEHLDGQIEDWQDDDLHDRMVRFVKAVFEFCTDTTLTHKADAMIGRRLIALAWVVCPDAFDGASLASIAPKLGFTPAILHSLSAEVSRTFKVQNRRQSQGRNGKHAERLIKKEGGK